MGNKTSIEKEAEREQEQKNKNNKRSRSFSFDNSNENTSSLGNKRYKTSPNQSCPEIQDSHQQLTKGQQAAQWETKQCIDLETDSLFSSEFNNFFSTRPGLGPETREREKNENKDSQWQQQHPWLDKKLVNTIKPSHVCMWDGSAKYAVEWLKCLLGFKALVKHMVIKHAFNGKTNKRNREMNPFAERIKQDQYQDETWFNTFIDRESKSTESQSQSSTSAPSALSVLPIIWVIDLIDLSNYDHQSTQCSEDARIILAMQYKDSIVWCDSHGNLTQPIYFWNDLKALVHPYTIIQLPKTRGFRAKECESKWNKRLAFMGNIGKQRAWSCLIVHIFYSSTGLSIQRFIDTCIYMDSWSNEMCTLLINAYASYMMDRLIMNISDGATQFSNQLTRKLFPHLCLFDTMITKGVWDKKQMKVIHLQIHFKNANKSNAIHNAYFPGSTLLDKALDDFYTQHQMFKTSSTHLLCTTDFFPLVSTGRFSSLLNLPLDCLLQENENEIKPMLQLRICSLEEINNHVYFYVKYECKDENESDSKLTMEVQVDTSGGVGNVDCYKRYSVTELYDNVIVTTHENEYSTTLQWLIPQWPMSNIPFKLQVSSFGKKIKLWHLFEHLIYTAVKEHYFSLSTTSRFNFFKVLL